MKSINLCLLLCLFFSVHAEAQTKNTPRFAIKTNVLYDATTTFNLSPEIRVSNKFTLEIPVNYNPWTFDNNKKIKHLLVQPEFRYWLCDPFEGHFFGVHGHYGHYNVGGVGTGNMKDYRYQGDLYGAGISYGYHWILSNRWSIEATLGIGYAYLDYEKYECGTCGKKVGDETKNYFGPTKAGISLIYFIK